MFLVHSGIIRPALFRLACLGLSPCPLQLLRGGKETFVRGRGYSLGTLIHDDHLVEQAVADHSDHAEPTSPGC